LVVLIFTIAVIIGLQGLQIATLDTRSKISVMVEKFDVEIAALKAKLDARRRPSD
jgi:hypothetical protein